MVMELQNKKYHFPEHAVQLAEKSGLAQFTQKVVSACEDDVYTPLESYTIDRTEDIDRYIARFAESELVNKLPTYDRASVRSTAQLLDLDTPRHATWGLRSWNQVGDLTHFSVPKKIGAIVCSTSEIIILSGAGYQAHLATDEPKARALLEDSTRQGFTSKLDFMIFAGAFLSEALAAQHKSFHVPSTYTRVVGDTVKEVAVVGSMHGDFRMYQKTMTSAGSLTPNLRETIFSPVIYSEVSGYHSIEPAFAAAICAFIIEKSDTLEKAHGILMSILENPQVTHMHAGAGLYGDYANRDSESETDMDIDYALINLSRGRSLMRLVSVPGSETSSLDLDVIDSKLVVRNNRSGHYNAGIHLDYIDAIELLKTFTGIGGAAMRTSEDQIIQVVIRAANATGLALQKSQSVHEVLTVGLQFKKT